MIRKIKSTPAPQMPPRSLSSSASWILRGCKHPRTPSLSFENNENFTQHGGDEATLSDVDRFLMENFKSLYRNESTDDEDENENEARTVRRDNVTNHEEKPGGILFESPKSLDPPENLRSSRRFFVGQSSSSSLIEDTRVSLTLTSGSATEDLASSSAASGGSSSELKKRIDDSKDPTGEDFITVLKYSPNPYEDFKRSMHEMVDARLSRKGKIDWEFMEELLFCYLKLNDKKSYRYILRAFVDLVVVLRGNSDRVVEKARNLRLK